MKKFVCKVCGYIYESETKPRICPLCKQNNNEFEEVKENINWNDINRIGLAQNIDEEIIEGIRKNYRDECEEVAMYIAMSRQAIRDGHHDIAELYRKIAYEEAEHASKFGELLGEILVPDTKKNLQNRVQGEFNATNNKLKLAKRAKELGLEEIYSIIYQIYRDEARHEKKFLNALEKNFKK